MGRITAVVAVLALCVLAACADLPPLGACGNGVVEANLGEDCDDPDATTCLACRLVCDSDLPDDGVCPDGATCCLAGQRCGQDDLCRAPSGRFATPTTAFPFAATQIAVVDIDADGIGDAFGVNRSQASFLYGAIGGPTRQATTPIPLQSRPDSQVLYARLDRGGLDLPAIVAGTPRGFAVLATDGSRMFSPPLPEVELEMAGGTGGGTAWDHGLAAGSAANGDIVVLVEELRSDRGGGTDRVALRVFHDRVVVPGSDRICGKDFVLAGGPEAAQVIGDMRIFSTGAGEFVFASVAAVVTGGGGPVLDAGMCMYASPPIGAAPRTDFLLPDGRVPVVMRPVQLDLDDCPEVVAELADAEGLVHEVAYWDTADAAGAGCTVVDASPITSGHLLGAGDLDADGRDEVIIDRRAYTGVLSGAAALPDLILPEGLDVAVVADVNRDGRADLAGIATNARDLVVVLRVDAGYAPRTVASVGALHELVAGDFDADTYPDFASIETPNGDIERVVVAFGGETGPQTFASIGPIPGAHALVAHVDRVPAVSSDAFADLMMIDQTFEGEEVSQFNGSPTRALTSQIDLTGPPPSGDDGKTFARTIAGGELVPPYGDADDFCTVSFGKRPAAGGEASFAWAFCIGGQGANLAMGDLDDAGAFSAAFDTIDAGESIPLVAGVAVANGASFPDGMIVALRRDTYSLPELVVMAPPGTATPTALPTARLADVFPLPALAAGDARHVFTAAMRAVQLDADADSELIVSLFDYVVDAAGDAHLSSLVYRVDLAATGGQVGAVAVPFNDPRQSMCSDAALAELGDVAPDGTAAAPGPELVLVCDDALQAWFRGAGGAVMGPFVVGRTDGIFGRVAVGDVTGDRLDDLAILLGEDRDALLVIMPQCPAHDTSACTTSIPAGDP